MVAGRVHRRRFGSRNWVHRPEVMRTLRAWFEEVLAATLPAARLL